MGNVGGSNTDDVATGRAKRRAVTTLVVLSVLGALLVFGIPSGAFAHLPSSPPLLALEGSATADGPSGALPDDWDRLYCANPTSTCSPKPAAPHSDADLFVTPVIQNFGGGSKDTLDISGGGQNWDCGLNSPGKDQMSDVFAAAYDDPATGHTILYFGADRQIVNGDANIGFWFIQDPDFSESCPGGDFTGVHKEGDIFIASQFTNGGSQPTIDIYKWTGGSLVKIASDSPCPTPLTSSVDGCAIVNTSPVTVPWQSDPIPTNGFFEGGLDLNELTFTNGDVPCFSNFLGDTRTSQSVGSSTKNFGAGQLSTCANIELKKHWVGAPATNSLGIGTTQGGSESLPGGSRVDVSSGDGTTGSIVIDHGTYHLDESLTPSSAAGGYTVTDFSCTNSSGGAPTPTKNTDTDYSVTLGSGDNVVCTYTNTYNLFSPSISTTLVPAGPIAIGAQVHDTASLSSASTGAGGTVTYRWYPSQAACTADTAHSGAGGTTINTVTVTNGVVPQSDNVTFPSATTVYFQAVYSGDSKNNPAVSSCSSEPMTISPNPTGITTTLVPAGPVSIGAQVHDTASLSGKTATAGGSVTYRYYATQAACTADTNHNGGTLINTVTVTNGVVPQSDNVSFSSATTVYFQAVYSGDTNNLGSASTCSSEPMTINPNPTTIATTLVPASPVIVGTAVHDTANLSGNTANAGGTVTYRYYTSQAACTTDTNHNGGTLVSTVTVTNGNVPQSDPVTFSTTGTVYWQAVYSGDTSNVGSASPCSSEPMTINPKAPSIATDLKPAATVAIGTSVHDTATISNATSDASGSVDYRYYTSQAACTADTSGNGGTDVGPVTVTNGIVPPSASVSFNSAQTVYWRAIYTGDGNNQGAKSDCSTEQLSVVDASISITPGAATNKVGDAHTFTVTVHQNDGSGSSPATVGNVDVTLTDSNGAVSTINAAASTCDDAQPSGDNLDANGQCILVINSSSAGKVTAHATVHLTVGGVDLVRQTDNTAQNSGDAVKTYVDAQIAITPGSATNKVGDAHTFTVTVLKNDGSGGTQPTPATVGNVDVTLIDSNGAVSTINAAASTCDDAQPSGDNLDANGQCILVINSSSAGKVTAHATVHLTVGGVDLVRQTDNTAQNSGDAVKTYVDAQIAITPATATNAVGDPHTFTVTVLKNDGSGGTQPTPATVGNVDVTLIDSNGAVSTINAAASTCDDAQPSGDNLDANGQCILVINSNHAGKVTAHATVHLTVGGVDLVRQTDGTGNNSGDAVKNYVNASISITPSTATNKVGDAHTFTVTVLADTGSGPAPATVGNVDVTLTDSNGAVSTINAAASTCDDAQPSGDNLDANGQCILVINSSSAGKVTAHATVNLTVGGVAFVLETDGTGSNSGNAVKTYVDAQIAITPGSATNKVGDAHTFTVTVLKNDGSGGTQPTPATVGNVDVTLIDSNGAVSTINAAASTCDDAQPSGDNLDANGQCILVINSSSAGKVTAHATVHLTVGGVDLVRQTDNTAQNSGDAVKTYVDASIAITPGTATNKVGDAHTFTVTVHSDNGSGTGQPALAASGHVAVTLTDSNGAVSSVNAAASTCDDAGSNLTNGQCILVINSSSAGKVTAHATVDLTVGGIALHRETDGTGANSGNAVKTYVDARIVISPLAATNEVTHAHTFTVTVTQNLGDGNGFVKAVGAPVGATAAASNGATITSAGGTTPACGSGVTDAGGQCTIVVNSSSAGTIAVNATTTITIGSVTITRSTGDSTSGDSGSGVKTYVDASIAITPGTATNKVGDAHTFTVTVHSDNGSGTGQPALAASGHVAVTLTDSNGAVSSVNAAASTCDDAGSNLTNGQCILVINSSSAGKVTAHATVDLTVGGIALHRETDGTGANSADAVKTYVDANIAITPLTPTNQVGTAHTFTVTVQKNLGAGGYVPAAGETVSVNVTGSNGATVANAHPDCVGIANSPAKTTDAGGKCTIVVNSSTAGQLTVNASVTLSVGGVSLTRSTGDQNAGDSANGLKTYVDSYITISPATAQNNVTVTHTFTVQVFTNDGSGAGYLGSNGQTVTFALLAGSVGSFTGGAPHTCTTQTIAGVAGQCTITTTSSVAGTDHMQATTTVTVGGVSMTRTTGTAAPGHVNSDNAAKTWVQPSIGITKNPKSQTFVQGGTATFTIVVTNTGPVTLSNVRVTDALSPNCAKTSAAIAGLASLAPGASVTYTCTLANVQSSFTNSATATGTPVGGGPDVTATDTAPVTVTPPPPPPASQNPAIAITKNPKSQSILTGQTATFTIVVTNTGDVTLTNVTVTDQLSPDCNKTSAQIAALGAMAPGASVTYNCSLGNVQASFTNVAVATGTPPSGQNVTAQDSAPVTVNAPLTPPAAKPTPTHPAIDIVKDPKSQTIGEGGKATFKITVTNTGDVTLSDVTVTDPRSTDCNRNLGTLGVGQSKTYTCTKDDVKADFQNVATATGKPPTGARVSAKDNANIAVKAFIPPQHPRIAIVKSPKNQSVTTKLTTSMTPTGANKTTVSYGTAHFTIKVTNTGDVALHDVTVNDPLSTNCNKGLGTIAPHKSKTYTCSKPAVTANYTNVAAATGTSPKGVKVHATDHAKVKVTTKTTSTSGAKFTG